MSEQRANKLGKWLNGRNAKKTFWQNQENELNRINYYNKIVLPALFKILPIKFFIMDDKEVQKIITSDRTRTNLLKNAETKALGYLVQVVPRWISSDMLTFIGFLGSLTIFLSFILAAYIDRRYLLIGIIGFAINWFGDSLDGRIAFYRNKIRKWYGFTLDLTMDWINIIIMGLGFMIYTEGIWEYVGFGFVVLYGWAMINTLVRYKISSDYVIDSGIAGPTEVRIIISAVFIAEIFYEGAINYFSAFICILLFLVNLHQMSRLLKMADLKDKSEKNSNAVKNRS